MMVSGSSSFSRWVGVFLLSIVVDVSGTHQVTDRIVVSYVAAPKFTLHEPVVVQFSIKNRLNEPISLDLGHNRKTSFLITVLKPNGSIVRVPELSSEGLGAIGRISLDPMQQYSQRLLLNEWYDFSEPGTYMVDINLAAPIQANGGSTINVATKKRVKIYVAPRDADALKRKCEELGNAVAQSASYAEAEEAARALSYIRDSVAVPYLKTALDANKLVSVIILDGLSRLSSDEAIEVIISAAQSQNQDTAEYAKGILFQLQAKVRNPALREKIKNLRP